MGIFDLFFGSGKSHSPLEPDNPLSKQLDDIRGPLEDLADQAKDSLEVVPADKATYVFIGKPPRQFGIAWVKDGKVFNLKSLADEKGISPTELQKTSSDLSKAYSHSMEDTRYSTKVGQCKCLIAESRKLGKDVDRIIRTVSS